MVSKLKDNLFTAKQTSEHFEFNESVARVFDDMLERSVPFYRECLDATVKLCLRFVRENGVIYDLGCSTGALLEKLAESLPNSVRLVGIDNSAPMLDKARERLCKRSQKIDLVLGDLNHDIKLSNASIVVINYTLQFIPLENRENLLRQVKDALTSDGALILIEKVKGAGVRLEKEFIDLHHEFKHDLGYSLIEISRKKEALENVLIPFEKDENLNLLSKVGFDEVDSFFRWFNFAGFIAIKNDVKN